MQRSLMPKRTYTVYIPIHCQLLYLLARLLATDIRDTAIHMSLHLYFASIILLWFAH